MKIKKAIALGSLIGIGVVFTASFVVASPTANNIQARPLSSSSYFKNERGETYGAYSYEATIEPNLILTEGENGVTGYVKASDMDLSVSSPEEAINYQDTFKAIGYRSIPLYKSDGITVIGEFRLYYSDINTNSTKVAENINPK